MSAHLTRDDVTAAALAAKPARGLAFTGIAGQLGRPRAWPAAALLAQHPLSPEDAARVGEGVRRRHRERDQRQGGLRAAPALGRVTGCGSPSTARSLPYAWD